MKKLLLLFLFLLPLPSYASSVLDIASSGLVAFWEFEETSGVRYDSYASYDLNEYNTVTSATGKQGLAADFEKDNSEYLSRLVDDVDFDLQGNWTVAFWFKFETAPTSFTYSPSFLAKETTNNGWNLRTSYADGKSNWVKNDAVTYDSTTSFASSTWYFLAVTKDTNIKVYVNGVQQSSTAYTAHTNVNNSLNVGRSPHYTTRYFDGLIDELGFWSSALSSSTVALLYNGGVGVPYEADIPTSTSTSPFLSFNMFSMLDAAVCSAVGATTTCVFDYGTSSVSVMDSIQLSALVLFTLAVLAVALIGFIFTVWIMRA